VEHELNVRLVHRKGSVLASRSYTEQAR
jgi:hypothetical protein